MVFSTGVPFISFAQSYNEKIGLHRQEIRDELANDPLSPVRKDDIKYMNYYPPDSNYRVPAHVTRTENAPVFEMPTSDGKKKEYRKYATLDFFLGGEKYRLSVYQSMALIDDTAYASYLFLPFTDSTSAIETYGSGRYLNLSSEDIKNDSIEVDFNKAYNPYCAYSAGYSCPRPPKENALPVAIRAGEKNYTGPIRQRRR